MNTFDPVDNNIYVMNNAPSSITVFGRTTALHLALDVGGARRVTMKCWLRGFQI